MKTVFLYAGQGSQKVGMGKDWYDNSSEYRKVADSARLTFDWKSLMEEGPIEKLSQTEYTQPCMAIFAAGVTAELMARGITPDAAMGLSLGEYGALYAAGVFEATDYIDIVSFRGQKMAEASKGLECSMSAILGMPVDVIESACEEACSVGYVTAVNYNCPGQVVICGDEAAVARAEELLKEQGMRRSVRLQVSGPFHTKYMKPAGDALKERFETMSWSKPTIPVAMNVTGRFLNEEENIKELLVKQVQSSVHFEENLRQAIEAGAENFIEIGPGNALSGFLKKTIREYGRDINTITIESYEDIAKLEALKM